MASSGSGAHRAELDEALRTALEFLRGTLTRTADEVRPLDAGWVVMTPSLPAAWGLNHLRIARPLSFAGIVELAERELAAVPYRHVVVEDDETGRKLEEPFRAAGWKMERDLLMILAAEPDGVVDTSRVIEAEESKALELMRQWHLEVPHEISADALRQLVEYSRREGRAWAGGWLGVADDDGRLIAITDLRSDGRTAQVEDVYAVPEARGRGFGRALVTHAAALARAGNHDLIFITADDNDWPKELYARVGFRPMGRMRTFHREAPAPA